ncbi:MAG: DegQ family serine endoprotease [Betaproteobacteria bacterium]|nr:DegQ family serine endoprotease [Betaproteobacteria bacterium]
MRVPSVSSLLLLLLLAAPAAPAALPFDGKGLPTLAPMLAQVTPAVVNISVVTRSPMEDNPLFRDPLFRRFFNIPERPSREQSAGSGVIVDRARGYVLTNNHVINNAQEVVVTLKDRRALKARLVGTDPGTDIAVLKIDAHNLAELKFGDSDVMNVGDFVVAIGNPFGIGQTVTSGIVSALGRTGLGIEGYEDFIQTDASINPGNSGGALVNLAGELIGINTAIIGPSGSSAGIGFAVPSNMVRSVMQQIIRFGEVRRGRVGVVTQDMTHELAQSLAAGSADGAVVVKVEPGSPADKAGLKPRDIVTGVSGKPVRGAADLRNRMGLIPVGEEVELQVQRGGRPLSLRLRIAELFTMTEIPGEAVPQLAGVRVSNIEPGMPAYGIVEGAMVTRIEPDSPGAKTGLRPGDVLYGVNRSRARSVPELLAALRQAERPLRIFLLRGDSRLTLTLR